MDDIIDFELNGKNVSIPRSNEQTLLWALRNHFGLTGTKYGCGMGYCGACTVLLNDETVRTCMISMEDVAGKRVVTIEGIASGETIHPVQQAFVDHDAMQCGYCTPGMIMNAVGFLHKHPHPTHEEIISGMDDNYCRCGAHPRIVAAVEEAAGTMRNEKGKDIK
ncbi:MAG: (2Fe-2S)-binding protein [Bacteroidetes bacterium]|nr:(2Fe-2S)-binding protein [Bacteroidota bacterium]